MPPKEFLQMFQEAFLKYGIVVVDIKEITEFDPATSQQVLESKETLSEFGGLGRSSFTPKSVFKIAFICYAE
jgi:hypothetical protein